MVKCGGIERLCGVRGGANITSRGVEEEERLSSGVWTVQADDTSLFMGGEPGL